MTLTDLSMFFRPNGVAVIGASRDPQKFGYSIVHNLLSHHYKGMVYPINPTEERILDLTVYPEIGAAPDPLDLAVIAIPAPAVPAAVEACGIRGVKGVIIVSGGFREVGPEGVEREEAVARIAAQYGIRVIGPNCIGAIDAHTPLNTTFVTGMPRPGEIAFLSQSGAVAAAVMDWAVGSGVGFSRIVSLGNQVDVTTADMLGSIGQDGRTRVVTAYVEGIEDGRKFVEAASRTARDLPLVVLKAGRSDVGARAVSSHTGALAGDKAAYEAAFRRAGVLSARTMEELFDWGRTLAWQPLPKGNRVGILTNAGGAGILAVDALVDGGLEIATLQPETKEFLRKRVFAAASVENPVDILAGSGPATYAVCLDALLADENVDAVVVIQAPQDWFAPLSLAEVVGEVANSPLGRKKPVLAVIMGLASTSDATQVLHRKHIPNFAFPERVGSTLAAMWQRKQWLENHTPEVEANSLEGVDREAAGAVLIGIDGWLPPDRVEVLLRAYGIEVPGSGLAQSSEEAVELADSVGYPVALKLTGSRIVHKSDVGGVTLNVKSADEVRVAFDGMVSELPSELEIDGVMVQHMVRGQAELIVGMVRDTQFGPLVMVGTGGTQVELLKDVTFELAPLTGRQADEMLDRTAAGRLLAGYRGAAPADRAAVVEVIVQLAQIAVDWPGIEEIEINPLIVMEAGRGAAAVDGRVRVIVGG